MNPHRSGLKNVSDTAFWVAYYRAIESKKKTPVFRDPFASLLVGEYGEKVSSSLRAIEKYAYWSVIIRTRLIDECLLKYIGQGYKTVINLGAGLDTRPYRHIFPPNVHWIEIDFPAVIEFKNEKLKNEQPRGHLERIGLNLSEQLERERLFCELNTRVGPAIVLTEGVIPYLTEDAVSSLAKDIKKQSNFTLWLAEYYAPEVYPRYQSPKIKGLMGDASFQFFPPNWFSFFEDCGWTQKEIHYLHDEAEKHGRKFPLPWWAAMLRVFVGEKRMMRRMRKFWAYIVFEKNRDG